jgi:hypothetical protein
VFLTRDHGVFPARYDGVFTARYDGVFTARYDGVFTARYASWPNNRLSRDGGVGAAHRPGAPKRRRGSEHGDPL